MLSSNWSSCESPIKGKLTETYLHIVPEPPIRASGHSGCKAAVGYHQFPHCERLIRVDCWRCKSTRSSGSKIAHLARFTKIVCISATLTPDETDRIQLPPTLNRQNASSIAPINDPHAQIERPFLMPPRNSAVLFARLELFQCRESLFPCEFARIAWLAVRICFHGCTG